MVEWQWIGGRAIVRSIGDFTSIVTWDATVSQWKWIVTASVRGERLQVNGGLTHTCSEAIKQSEEAIAAKE